MNADLIIAGGGAAGFFCAVNAARMMPGRKVLLLEKSGKFLSKVRISGGGRCNVTHACYDIETMSRNYPRGKHFVRKAFHHFFTTDCINWFAERGVQLKTEPDGRMFPVTNSSQTIIDCLQEEARRYGVETRLNAGVQKIERTGAGFNLELQDGSIITSEKLCVATGGFSKDEQFQFLRHLGHSIEPPVPSLFTFNLPSHPITSLQGISLPQVKLQLPQLKMEQEGPILITHWGLSGPAVLKLSAFAARELKERNWNFTARIKWLPQLSEELLRHSMQLYRKAEAGTRLYSSNEWGLPARLWQFLLAASGIGEQVRWADLKKQEEQQLIRNLIFYEVEVKGKTTFKEEFVTAGGVLLKEIEPHTMQSRLHPGLFFAGEIMDVDGITGGFNFQHAWTSGYLAAKAISSS